MIAEKFIGEKSRDYMNARRVAKEYEAITRGIDRSFLSLPPCGSIEEIKQVRISLVSHTVPNLQFLSKSSNSVVNVSFDRKIFNFFQIFEGSI